MQAARRPRPMRRDGCKKASPTTSADSRPRAPAGLVQLPSDVELDAGGTAESAAYDRAWWFATFVAHTYGSDGLRRLYVAACQPGHPDADTATRTALGVSLPDLVSGWQRWLAG
jgi:hypothetical protein